MAVESLISAGHLPSGPPQLEMAENGLPIADSSVVVAVSSLFSALWRSVEDCMLDKTLEVIKGTRPDRS